jgi:hypothetical protein
MLISKWREHNVDYKGISTTVECSVFVKENRRLLDGFRRKTYIEARVLDPKTSKDLVFIPRVLKVVKRRININEIKTLNVRSYIEDMIQ